MKHKLIKISTHLILKEHQFDDVIVFYHYLQSKKNKNIYFDYNPHIISKFSGLPVNKVRKLIGQLKKLNYVHIEGKNLIIKSTRNVLQNKGIENIRTEKLYPYRILDFDKFKAYIFAYLIKKNQDNQRFMISVKNPKNNSDLKLRKKYVKKHQEIDEGFNSEIINSYRGLSNYFGKSISFIQYWIKKSKDKGLIDINLKLEKFSLKQKFKTIKERNTVIKNYLRTQSLFYKYFENEFFVIKGSIIDVKLSFR